MSLQPAFARSSSQSRSGSPIRVLIVDDSIVARTILVRMLEPRAEFKIVDAVPDAAQALRVVNREQVDIVVLDLEMPGVSGIALLPQLLEAGGETQVLICSSAAAEGAAVSIEALALGAADVLQKPGAGQLIGGFADTLIDRIIRIASGRCIHCPPLASKERPADSVDGPIDCLAIGASTGGIHALNEFMKVLSPAFQAPILITQHLPAAFMPYFAQQLRDMTGRPTTVAQEGERLVQGHVYVAPGDGHMRLTRFGGGVRILLDTTPAVSMCMPSVDPMFESIAEIYGARAIAVVLSGMGRDGSIGARAVAAAGAEIFAQDPETSVVWGMPGAVTEAGLTTAVLAPERIAQRINDRLGQRA